MKSAYKLQKYQSSSDCSLTPECLNPKRLEMQLVGGMDSGLGRVVLLLTPSPQSVLSFLH